MRFDGCVVAEAAGRGWWSGMVRMSIVEKLE